MWFHTKKIRRQVCLEPDLYVATRCHTYRSSCALASPMARGPSSERAFRRRPSYHLPLVSFAHLYGARPERASFSLPFCPFFPRYGARPEQASLSFALLLNLPPFWRGGRAGQLMNALLLFKERGPSGPADHLRGPSGPVCHLPLCLICGAPPTRVKSTPWAGGGGRLIILSKVAASRARRVTVTG